MADADPFDAFVREFQDMVFATAVRLLGRPAEAEDVAQSVFLKAFERFSALDGNPAAPGWLKTVTTNACLNHLSRHRARWRLFSELDHRNGHGPDAGLRFSTSLRAPAAEQPDRAYDAAAASRRLEDAVRSLPDHQRVPLVLFHFEEWSYQAIAAELGVSLGKVKTDIHRGREALRRTLDCR
jgi:RNA polymerase sigma-70 factor (ECF subfamily)